MLFRSLCARGFQRLLFLVNFGSKPADSRKYANKRAEMYGELKSWLSDLGGAVIPDNDQLDTEITAAGYKTNSNQQLVLESKDDIRARLNLSPDGGDAAALTFAEPVRFVSDAESDVQDDWDTYGDSRDDDGGY